MDKDEFKLPKTAGELFASHVVEERDDPAGLRKAVVKVLGMTQVSLKEATGLSTLAIHRWCNNRVESHEKTREKITAALTIAYVQKYNPNAQEALPPFENL